jgi:hypothetical protein
LDIQFPDKSRFTLRYNPASGITAALRPACPGWVYKPMFRYYPKRSSMIYFAGQVNLGIRRNKMAKKEKLLCKWKEDDINKKFDKFCDIVRNSKFVCKKCGRVADKKKWLHKAVALN